MSTIIPRNSFKNKVVQEQGRNLDKYSVCLVDNTSSLLYYLTMETKETNTVSTTCPNCGNAVKRFGKHRNGLQRFRCLTCRKTFTEPHKAPFQVADYLKEPARPDGNSYVG